MLDRYRTIFHLEPHTIERGERLFDRYGPAAVYFARFIFGMRVIAGPLAGVLRMHWPRFATFNLLGAATWVAAVSLLGYTFGKHWDRLVPIFRNVNIALGVLAGLAAIWLWRRYKKKEDTGRAGE